MHLEDRKPTQRKTKQRDNCPKYFVAAGHFGDLGEQLHALRTSHTKFDCAGRVSSRYVVHDRSDFLSLLKCQRDHESWGAGGKWDEKQIVNTQWLKRHF